MGAQMARAFAGFYPAWPAPIRRHNEVDGPSAHRFWPHADVQLAMDRIRPLGRRISNRRRLVRRRQGGLTEEDISVEAAWPAAY